MIGNNLMNLSIGIPENNLFALLSRLSTSIILHIINLLELMLRFSRNWRKEASWIFSVNRIRKASLVCSMLMPFWSICALLRDLAARPRNLRELSGSARVSAWWRECSSLSWSRESWPSGPAISPLGRLILRNRSKRRRNSKRRRRNQGRRRRK